MSNRVSKEWSMGNNRSVGNDRLGNSLWVGSSARVADLRDEAIIVIGVVVDSLDTAVRKVDRVGSLHHTIAVIGLSLVEGSSRVVISNSVVIVVRGDLSKVRGSITSGMSNSHGVGNGGGSMDQRGVGDDRGSMDNRTSDGMGHGVSDAMGQRVSKAMGQRVGDHSTGSMEPVRGVRD